MVASLPGFAALLALLFTWMQVTQTSKELRITEQGQITNRFNAAINNLGSTSLDVRLGGIYALGRIMDDSARDHPTVVSVLSAYLRTHAAVLTGDKRPHTEASRQSSPEADVQAVMTVLGNRRSDLDRGDPIDLRRTSLRGVQLDRHPNVILFREAVLSDADLGGSSLLNLDLRGAWLDRVNLTGAALTGSRLDNAFMYGANFAYADVSGSHFNGADLHEANLTGTHFCGDTYIQPAQGGRGTAAAFPGRTRWLSRTEDDSGSPADQCADLANVELIGANLTNALLPSMNLTSTIFCPDPSVELGRCSNLTGAILSGSNLKGAHLSGASLRGADLTNVDLRYADLRNADLTGAEVSGARFEGAILKGVRGLPLSP
ncbi:pentapeptide repeat-containing protein [Streptomyces sp. NPDC050982]|uniref:pentapeptide repeat-containing protein n=1 Tax=Streptomyces sp. NPDC050982 TaxID=3154746 RepID=UPI0033E73EA3